MNPSLLTLQEKKAYQKELSKWTFLNDNIEKEFTFSNFKEAFGFITQVALTAETLGHHPNLQNIYNKVIIKLSTHDLGGISSLDIRLAKEIDKIDLQQID